MPTSTETLVSKIYIGLFGRAPDPAGLDYWTGEINNRVRARVTTDPAFDSATSAEKSILLRAITNDVMKSFTNAWILDGQGNPTAEWQAGNGQFDITTASGAAGLVSQLYVNLFGRVPSGTVDDRRSEIGYWAAELSILPTTGKFTPAEMIAALIAAADNSPFGADATTMGFKASAASYYAERVGNGHSDAAARDAVVNVFGPASLAASQQQTDAIAPASNDGQILTGTESPDSILGTSGDDTLDGADGADVLNAGRGNDTLDGWVDDDLLLGGAGNDSLLGFSGNDTLVGGTGSDTLLGEAGEDVFDFSDTLFNDPVAGLGSASFDALDVIVDFDDSEDTILLPDTFYHVVKGEVVWLDAAARSVGSQSSFDLLQQAAEDLFAILGEAAVLVGVVGNDSYVFFDDLGDGYGTVIQALGVPLSSWTVNDFVPNTGTELSGTDGDDSLVGSDANDLFKGFSGNDTLTGGSGSDVLEGGSGFDVFDFTDTLFNDPVAGLFSESFDALDIILDFEVGIDTIILPDSFYVFSNGVQVGIDGQFFQSTNSVSSLSALQQAAEQSFEQFGGGVYMGLVGNNTYVFFDDIGDGYGTVIKVSGVTSLSLDDFLPN